VPSYSRREFLQIIGVTLAGASLGALPPFMRPFGGVQPLQGRTLSVVPVLVEPRLDAPVVENLWPDSSISIKRASADWYRLEMGYAPREAIQPMIPYQPEARIAMPDLPFWAEVAGPIAAVRRYCAADAPLITRIGHGGVSRVVDALPDIYGYAAWYALEDDQGGQLGWTQAVSWRQVVLSAPPSRIDEVHIDQGKQRLTVWEKNQAVLSAPFSAGLILEPGLYSVQERRTGGVRYYSSSEPRSLHGVPWYTRLSNDYEVVGVYWHNRFGRLQPGPAIQVSPVLARWLQHGMGESSRIVIA
jgi:hypothetical protein